jgi:Protein of unknown function (DUF1488)
MGAHEMPLVSTERPGLPDSTRNAICIWMTVDGANPVAPIWVCVTYEALAQLAPSKPRDLAAAIATFDDNRASIEAAASKKFDADGADGGKYEGMPTLMMRTDDLI